MDGCLLEERFTGRAGKGYTSVGFGSLDFTVRQWHREYVDSRGDRIVLSRGVLVAGAMVMTGTRMDGGITTHLRVTWSPVSAAQFTQTWESSTDGVTYAPYASFVFDRK